MLNRLLYLLNTGKGNSLAEIARGLDAPLLMVVDMIQQLVKAGYLEEMRASADPSCSVNCTSACGAQHGCLLSGGGRVWQLTEKGRARASQTSEVL